MKIVKTEETVKLRPCPFCGEEKPWPMRIIRDGVEEGGRITCPGCATSFIDEEATCLEDIVSKWNRRAKDGRR